MMTWEEEQQIYDLRNEIANELKLFAFSFTDFDRQVVIETEAGEEIVPVKEISYEAKPNTRPGATERIIKDYTEKLGWEFVKSYKQAWVNGYVKHVITFKL
ncbi:MAG: hypothetical protein IJF83_07050 [Methanobrevibacter sp.]|nr:hypothetical protein [Methanobrevibacter sp.]